MSIRQTYYKLAKKGARKTSSQQTLDKYAKIVEGLYEKKTKGNFQETRIRSKIRKDVLLNSRFEEQYS